MHILFFLLITLPVTAMQVVPSNTPAIPSDLWKIIKKDVKRGTPGWTYLVSKYGATNEDAQYIAKQIVKKMKSDKEYRHLARNAPFFRAKNPEIFPMIIESLYAKSNTYYGEFLDGVRSIETHETKYLDTTKSALLAKLCHSFGAEVFFDSSHCGEDDPKPTIRNVSKAVLDRLCTDFRDVQKGKKSYAVLREAHEVTRQLYTYFHARYPTAASESLFYVFGAALSILPYPIQAYMSNHWFSSDALTAAANGIVIFFLNENFKKYQAPYIDIGSSIFALQIPLREVIHDFKKEYNKHHPKSPITEEIPE